MPNKTNHQVVLASRPKGEPEVGNFKLVEGPIPKAGPGEILLRTIFLSLDPYMRGRMSDEASYAPPVEVGAVMDGRAVCEVINSRLPGYKVGDFVVAGSGWQDYSLSDGKNLQRVDQTFKPLSYALGVLGMPGFTAYGGLLNIGQPQSGETLVVAAASGAVGSVVGQIAKTKGCRVIGIAGSEQKCSFVKTDLGFDECLNHRLPHFAERLQAACPSGIDIYFEMVGGAVLLAVLPLLNSFARIPVCGLIAHYNGLGMPDGANGLPQFMRQILFNRLTFRGFIYSDYSSQFDQFIADMSGWLKAGQVKYREDITNGLENAPRELIGLLRGENFGKKIIQVSQDPTES